jgi:dienelactone hydrolase
MPLAKARFEAGMQALREEATVDGNAMAAMGYCFGGGVVLNMARMGEPLKAALSFHGSLSTDTPAQAGQITARIASFTGEADAMITADKVAAFKQEMTAAQANFSVVTYPNVQHSFTNPDADALGKKFKLPLAYNADADKDSWQQAMQILREVFSKK